MLERRVSPDVFCPASFASPAVLGLGPHTVWLPSPRGSWLDGDSQSDEAIYSVQDMTPDSTSGWKNALYHKKVHAQIFLECFVAREMVE